jgi:hypothetical protein
VTEREFQGWVIQLAEARGWDVASFFPCRVGKRIMTPVQGNLGRGFPDLVLVRGRDILMVELKTDKKYPTPHQRDVHAKLERAGIDVRVWRPKDQDEIEAVLM